MNQAAWQLIGTCLFILTYTLSIVLVILITIAIIVATTHQKYSSSTPGYHIEIIRAFAGDAGNFNPTDYYRFIGKYKNYAYRPAKVILIVDDSIDCPDAEIIPAQTDFSATIALIQFRDKMYYAHKSKDYRTWAWPQGPIATKSM